MNLSKSQYTTCIQCPKALWLKKHKPSVLTPPDASALAVFERGTLVGEFACGLFPEGTEVAYSIECCKLDTLAMVRVLEKLRQEVQIE